MLARAILALVVLIGVTGGVRAQEDVWREGVQILVPQRPIVQPHGQAPVRISAAEASVKIRDRVAITEMAITVMNPGGSRAETQLLLPVPDGSAIRSFKLDSLGDDSAAVLLPAAEARRVYDAIVRKMVDPGLLEFAGLGLIRSSVFPVEPGQTQTFRVVYEQVLPAHAGRIDYVLPRTEALSATGVEWTIKVDVQSGSALGPIFSPSHPIDVQMDGANRAVVGVNAPNDPGSFRLGIVQPDSAHGAMTVIAYPDARVGAGQGGYFMLVAGPRAEWKQQAEVKREVTLVIDRSGSMRGDKIAQAKEAALQVLGGLREGEFFNIIDYSGTVERFADRPQPKSAETIEAARAYITAIEANGSTNLHDALVAALRQPVAEGALPLVLFLTDGRATDGVTSEVGIREAAKAANEHGRRVFTFGVGFDLNAPLLTGLAEATRAAPTFVLPEDNIEVKVSEVFDRLDGPVLVGPRLHGLTAHAGDLSGRQFIRSALPGNLPDMYAGDQVIVLGQYTTNDQFVLLIDGSGGAEDLEGGRPAGALRGRQMEVLFDPAEATVANSYVPRLWAQRRIADLIGSIRQAGAEGRQPEQELVDEIVRLSTEHGILTEYTSFLAAEETQYSGDVVTAGGAHMPASTMNSSRARDELSSKAVQARAGRDAVARERQLQDDYTNGYARQNAYVDAAAAPAAPGRSFGETRISNVQRANDQTLFQRANNRWVDARVLERENDAPDQTVEFGTEAYFALVDDLVSQSRQGLIANRGEVLLLNRGQLVLVRNPS